MPERQIILDYLRTAAAYWYVLLPSCVMALPDTIKWHRDKQFEFKFKWRISIALACLVLAQFLAYRNQSMNLARVIEDKRLLSMTINQINADNDKLRNAASQIAANKNLNCKFTPVRPVKTGKVGAVAEWWAVAVIVCDKKVVNPFKVTVTFNGPVGYYFTYIDDAEVQVGTSKDNRTITCTVRSEPLLPLHPLIVEGAVSAPSNRAIKGKIEQLH